MSQHAVQTGVWPLVPPRVPATMRAVVFNEFGDPDVLHVEQVPTPKPAAGEVLVRVAAVSVGRLLDLTSRAGKHPYAKLQPPHILGAEHAGIVAAVGKDTADIEIGTRVAVFPAFSCHQCPACRDGCEEACPQLQVMGVHLPGSYAEYTRVPTTNIYAVPDGVSPSDAAGLALAGPVAMNQLTQAGLEPDDWVLVQGAASALGSLTAALAGHLGGRVIATSRAQWKRDRLVALGAPAALDPKSDDFVEKVLGLTGGCGVKVAIDDLGDEQIWERTMQVLATRGTVVSSGAFLGGKVGINLMQLYSRCQKVLGVRTGNLASARRLWQEVDRGFRPVLDRVFPVAHAADAHRYLEADNNMGRVALTAATEEDWDTSSCGIAGVATEFV